MMITTVLRGGATAKGLLHYATFGDKTFDRCLFHEDITQLEQKNPALGIHVISVYTDFEDINIILWSILIFCAQIL